MSAASARLCGRPLKLFASQLQVVTVCAQHRQRVRVANRVACGMHSGRGCARRTMNSVKRGVAQQRKASRCYQPRQRARRHRSGKRRAKSQQCVCVELQRREAAGAFVLSCAQPGWTGGCKVRATATSSEASKVASNRKQSPPPRDFGHCAASCCDATLSSRKLGRAGLVCERARGMQPRECGRRLARATWPRRSRRSTLSWCVSAARFIAAALIGTSAGANTRDGGR